MGPGGGLLSLRAVFPFFFCLCVRFVRPVFTLVLVLGCDCSDLQHDCQQLDLLICLDKDERELSEVEK